MRREISSEGSIKEVERGRKYRVRFYYEDKDGVWRHSRQITVKGNLAKARKVRDELKAEIEAKLNSFGTIAEYAMKWHQDRKDLGFLAENTLIRDNAVVDAIAKYFPDILLEELEADHIVSVYQKLRSQGKSEDYIFKFHVKLSQIYKDAIKQQKVKYNPCDAITIKRPRKGVKRSLTKQQFIKAIKVIEESPLSGETVAVYLSLMAGLRKGEALGLEWEYVDLDNQVLHIRYQYSRMKSHQKLKTEYSIRTITIGTRTTEFLRRWKEQQSERIFDGGSVPNHYPVCSHWSNVRDFDKAHIVLTPFRKWLIRFFIENGITYEDQGEIKPYTFHELRHTHATQQAAAGTDPKTLQMRMGHSDISTTLNIYTHLVEENERKAASTIENLLI